MQPFEGDFFISQICAGFTIIKIGDLRLKVYPPSKDIWYESNYIFMETYEDALEQNCLEEDLAIEYLHMNGWKEENLKHLEDTLPKHIEYFKVDLYQKFYRKTEKEQVRLYLKEAEKEYSRLFHLRHSLDHMTAIGVATFSRWQYIIKKCTRQMNGKKFNFKHSNINVHNILSAYYDSQIDDLTIREIAKSDKWKSIWQFSKRNHKLFNCEAVESTDEQRKLVAWSSLYDSIHEMTDCPTDDIIEDNDAFDGWLILKNREQEEERKKSATQDRFAVHGNADEIFVPVKSKEEAEMIGSLNNPTSKAIIENRIKTINEKGEIGYDEFNDVKMKNRMSANQAGINAIKQRTGGK